MNIQRAEQILDSMTASDIEKYCKYWLGLTPKTTDDYFKRWLFSFCSAHTNWKSNVNGYNSIKDLGWLNDKESLLSRLHKSGCGMHNNRTKYIWQFKEDFYSNVDLYTKVQGNWTEHRNNLVKRVNGLGIAKVSFVLEMCFPLQAQITTGDTHAIQLYEIENSNGFKSKSQVELYHKMEEHWVEGSKRIGCPPFMSRSFYWNAIQNQPNCDYWAYVLKD